MAHHLLCPNKGPIEFGLCSNTPISPRGPLALDCDGVAHCTLISPFANSGTVQIRIVNKHQALWRATSLKLEKCLLNGLTNLQALIRPEGMLDWDWNITSHYLCKSGPCPKHKCTDPLTLGLDWNSTTHRALVRAFRIPDLACLPSKIWPFPKHRYKHPLTLDLDWNSTDHSALVSVFTNPGVSMGLEHHLSLPLQTFPCPRHKCKHTSTVGLDWNTTALCALIKPFTNLGSITGLKHHLSWPLQMWVLSQAQM